MPNSYWWNLEPQVSNHSFFPCGKIACIKKIKWLNEIFKMNTFESPDMSINKTFQQASKSPSHSPFLVSLLKVTMVLTLRGIIYLPFFFF